MGGIRNILIVGGGTAGWLTAAFLARTLAANMPGGIRITLVESSDIGILGVGEGTFPTIKATLAACGIGEAQFLRGSEGTFKQGIHFVDWVRPPSTGGGPNHYFHPFNQPSYKGDGLHLLPYWLLGAAGKGIGFAEAATMQKRVADAGRAPKRRGDPDFQGPMNYAYHFDAGDFAKLLAAQGKSSGVQHLLATVEGVELDDTGAIASVRTREAGTLTADLYIDCTGFRAALIGGALGVPFEDVSDTLFIDRALALQVPYARPDAPIASYTISTAQEAGWIWDIGLQSRRGTGYVFSSRHTDEMRAEQVLRRYLGPVADGLTPRLLKFRTGFRRRHWVKNCVAVGLSGGFMEPLESTGIMLIEAAAHMIGHMFPYDGEMAPLAKLFNETMAARYDRIVDFLKMHYCLSQRRDSAFWTDNADPATIPASLQDKFTMWRARPPTRFDFVNDWETFQPSSWQFVLYGMEFPTDLSTSAAAHPRLDQARREFQMLRQVSDRAIADLPPHRQLIEQICGTAQRRVG